jgi:hypothetical protein
MSPAMRDELSRITDDAYGIKRVSGPLRIIARGRFARNNGSGRGDSFEETAPLRFELMSVETALRADKLRVPPNKALQLTARWHASQVASFPQLEC